MVAFGEVDGEGALEWIAHPEAMQTAKCVRREALLTGGKTQSLVQATDAARAAYLVLDFGRLLRGFPHLRLRGRAGAVIDLGFARVAVAVESRLRYVCCDGLQEWTSPELATCRYLVMRIGSCPEEVEIDSVSLVERRVAVAARGRFATVDEDWERLWQTGEQTLAASRQRGVRPRRGTAQLGSALRLGHERFVRDRQRRYGARRAGWQRGTDWRGNRLVSTRCSSS